MKKLNIGCGYDQKKGDGWINIDKSAVVKPDIVVDVEQGLPFEADTFEYIYSNHALEHIRPGAFEFLMDEIARVAKDGCILDIRVPFDNIMNRTLVNHYRCFGFDSFAQFHKNNLRNYGNQLVLEPLIRYSRGYKLLYYLFPFLKKEVHFKFKIVKK